jgi:4-amino-4-deoxy-L-arabinose transferase-like glycosyltransferase
MSTTFPIEKPWPATPTPVRPEQTRRRWWRPVALAGRRGERVSLGILLAATTALYLWGLGASGYANDFYAAAVQAGTKSWKSFFFGSLDSNNVITVDKPPLSLWPMEISGRIFGFSSWSMLAPQAIEGVLSVWLLHLTVRRWFGFRAGLLAGALFAITPVAVLMFRFNNPDAMMTFLLVAAAYCVTRAVENGSAKWTSVAGVVMGLSFLAKGLQPFTVLPAFALAYLVAAPLPMRRRLGRLLLGGLGLVVGAGWWVLAVELTPAADRPYIGGSGDNSPLGLAFGYNGLSRLSGGAGGGPGGGFDGSTGIARLFNSPNGGQIAWLLPAALLAAVALAVMSRRFPRTDRSRAALLLWGGWLLVTGGVLSFASGIIHTYYTVELAPAIAALVAIGAVLLWRRRATVTARVTLAAGVLVTGCWSFTLLRRASDWHPWIAAVVLAVSVLAACALLLASVASRAVVAVAVTAGLLGLTGGSAAYAVDTTATAHTGSTPTAGPTVATAFGGGAGGLSGGGFPGGGLPGDRFPGDGFPGGSSESSGQLPSFGSGSSASQLPGNRSGFHGGPAAAARTNSALITLLRKAGTKWSAATIGAQSAAPLQLNSDTAVMAIGGFTGSDNAPTLAQFQKWVAEGKIHYFIGDGAMDRGFGGGPGGASGSSSAQITSWVESHFASKTVGGTTVYDLTRAKS